MVNWVACFSHTGSEVLNVNNALIYQRADVKLRAALTDNMTFSNDTIPYEKYLYRSMINIRLADLQDCIVTLNGYLGILNAPLLERMQSRNCKVYNIHPAPIQIYPELKGLDPQERLYEGIKSEKYTKVGCVIHEVTPQLDGGNIVYWQTELASPEWSKAQLYKHLHDMGTSMWLDFFGEELWRD